MTVPTPHTPSKNDAPAWASNVSLHDIASHLRGLKRVAVLTHAKPDGDAVGSTLAVARALIRCGIDAVPVYLGLWSRRFDPVVGKTPVVHEKHGVFARPPLSEIQDVLVLDTGSWNQLADAGAWLRPRSPRTTVIDHHAHGDADLGTRRFVRTSSAAVCEIAAELCAELLGVRSPTELPTDIAEPLLLGLATDTGWFRHSSTTPAVLRLAAELIDAGARHNWLYQTVEQGDEPSRLRLIARALGTLEFISDSKAAMMHVTQADLASTGGTLDDAGGLTDFPLSVGPVRIVAVLIELEPTLTKVSFRSKAGGNGHDTGDAALDIDVNALARRFCGGGHRHAAGAKLHAPLKDAILSVRDALRQAVQA